MRIMATHQYYWPDTPPYASMLRAIAERLAKDGHEVHVLSTQPSYKPEITIERQAVVDEVNGVYVRRIGVPKWIQNSRLVRVLERGLYLLAILWYAVIYGRFDVIMVSTQPPVFGGLFARWAAKLTGAKFVYHCMDIWPEVGQVGGVIRSRFLISLLRMLDRRNCTFADRVVVLSRDMKQSIRDRNLTRTPMIEIINNFNLPSFNADWEKQVQPQPLEPISSDNFRIIFAGNIGRFQGLDTLVDAIKLLKDDLEAELVLLGEGAAASSLRKRAGNLLNRRIHFAPHQSPEVARRLIGESSISVVSLLPEMHKYAYPSKTMTYLAEGKPLLVLADPASELAEFVLSNNIGIVLPPGDPIAIAEKVQELLGDPERLEVLARRAKQVGRTAFRESTTLDRWSKMFQAIQEEL